MTAWYREWFGEDYLDLYSHRDQGEADRHVRFVEQVLMARGPRPSAVLDLACGAGRHTQGLRSNGWRALGLDLSLTLLLRHGRGGWPRVAGDMRCLPFAGASFDWVLNFFTSFGYFETEQENRSVFEEVARILAPRGLAFVDYFNLDRALRDLVREEVTVRQGPDGAVKIEIERWWDGATHRLNKRIRLSGPGRPVRSYLESVRGYRANEVIERMGEAGLDVTERFGDFTGLAFDPASSERLILVARKR